MRTPRPLTGPIVSVLTGLAAWAALFSAVGPLPPAAAQASGSPAPRTFAFMGMLRGTDNQAKPDGAYTVRFALYTAPSGGEALWSETKLVQASGGQFTTVLGASAANPFPASLDFSRALFVGVTLGTDAEMTPRLPLQGVPYALFAQSMADGSVVSSKIADGSIGPRQLAADPASLAQVTGGLMRADPNGRIGLGVLSPAATLDVGGTGALKIPVGATEQRPTTPVEGMLRGNATTHAPEYYTGSSWQSVGGPGLPGGTADTVTASLTIAPGGFTSYNVDASAGASGSISITLPDAAATRGVTYIVRKVDNTLNRVTVRPRNGQKIDGLSLRAVRLPNEELRLESDGATWRASQRTEPLLGGWNLDQGLQRWRQGLVYAGKAVNGTGFGGVDVLVYGDSIGEGAYSSSYLFTSWPHVLKLKLQERYNPPGVLGGYGFIPSLVGTTKAWWPGASDGVNYGVEAIANYGLASNLRLLPNNPANTYAIIAGTKGVYTAIRNGDKAQIAFDGTDPLAVQKRLAVTRVEVIGVNSAQTSPQRTGPMWDVFTNVDGYAPQTPGTGMQGGSFPVEPQTQWGRRYPVGGQETPLDPTKRNLLQLTGPPNQEASIDLIAYNGDFDCGVRLHNTAFFGKTVTQVKNYSGWWESLGSFGAQGAADANGNPRRGATFAKLVLFDFITNEATGGTFPLTQFKADYTTLVERALSLNSRPSVLLLIPPPRWSTNPANSLTPEQYQPYVNVVYEIAEEHDNVAILDMWKYWGGGSPQKYPDGPVATQGWWSDGVHFNDRAQVGIAEFIYRALAN